MNGRRSGGNHSTFFGRYAVLTEGEDEPQVFTDVCASECVTLGSRVSVVAVDWICSGGNLLHLTHPML